jgi:AraC family transcriptional regulator
MEMSKAKMKKSTSLQLEAPRFENGKALVIAGLRSRYTTETMNGIPAQWERFAPHIGKIPGQVGHAAYGACWTFAGGIDYLTGVEVSSSSGMPGEFNVVDIPVQNTLLSP